MGHYNTFIFYGHGDGDVGATGHGFSEYELAKKITNKVVELLRSNGWSVLTNTKNNYYNNCTKGHTFSSAGIVIHINSYHLELANGVEFIKSFYGNRFKREINTLNRLNSELGFTNRGVKSRAYNSGMYIARKHLDGYSLSYDKDWYREIRDARNNNNDLGILEIGFISNISDVLKIVNNIDKIAKIIASEYLGKKLY